MLTGVVRSRRDLGFFLCRDWFSPNVFLTGNSISMELDNKIQGYQRISTQQELHHGTEHQRNLFFFLFLDGILGFAGEVSTPQNAAHEDVPSVYLGHRRVMGFIGLFCKTKRIKLTGNKREKKLEKKFPTNFAFLGPISRCTIHQMRLFLF